MSLAKTLRRLEGGRGPAEVFTAFCKIAACALTVGKREEEYLAELKRWPADAPPLFAEAFAHLVMEMEHEPFRDCLGAAYMENLSHSSAQRGGEFHTPAEVCEMMALLTMGEIPAEGHIRLCEPACGAGAQIMAAAKAIKPEDVRRLRVLATDISVTAVHMCFINTTLWGIPAIVIHGNTISGEQWDVWPNFHMTTQHPFTWRTIFNSPKEEEPEPTAEAEAHAFVSQPEENVAVMEPPVAVAPPPPLIQVARRAARAKAENPNQLAFF
jgi:hypothetical protein